MAWIEPITYVDKTPTEMDSENVTHIHYVSGQTTNASKVGCYTKTHSYSTGCTHYTRNHVGSTSCPNCGASVALFDTSPGSCGVSYRFIVYCGNCNYAGPLYNGSWSHTISVTNYQCELTQGTSIMGVIKLIKTDKDLSITVENGASGTVTSTISYLWSTGETTDTIRTHGHGTYYCDVTVTETLSNQSHTERVSCAV